MKKRDAYHPDYLTMYPCLKERPDILKFLKQCDRKQEYLEYDLKVNRTRTNKRTMETVIWPQRELSYEHLLEEHQFAQQEPSPEETLLHEIELENLRCAVERLPNDERLLLHLRYWCDFSQAEIAPTPWRNAAERQLSGAVYSEEIKKTSEELKILFVEMRLWRVLK